MNRLSSRADRATQRNCVLRNKNKNSSCFLLEPWNGSQDTEAGFKFLIDTVFSGDALISFSRALDLPACPTVH